MFYYPFFPLLIIGFFANKLLASTTPALNPKAQLEALLNNEDIKNTWQTKILKECLESEANKNAPRLNCKRKRIGFEYLDVEYFNEKPLVLKISKFINSNYLHDIKTYYTQSSEVESQGVEGYAYSKGYQGRRADGLWLEHDVPIMQKLFHKIQTSLRINPAIAEEFLILNYEKMGHYAIHYDHLDPMLPLYDEGWFAYYGNRVATTLLIVKTASEGGYTVFPRLRLAIQPEEGDLILWFNADSNDKREMDSLHAACPILEGTKMAISLWIRGNFQEHMKCSTKHPGYDAENIFRNKYSNEEPKIAKKFLTRPKIPKWLLFQ